MNRQERWGLLALAVLLMGLYGLGALFPARDLPASSPDKARISNNHSFDFQLNKKYIRPQNTRPLTPFDPNTIGEAEWIEMGISAKTAQTILRYLSKGGRFRQPEDLQKIWGIKQDDCRRLMPFVKISASTVNQEKLQRGSERSFPTRYNEIKKEKRQLLDINGSDSAAWESLPGIGPGYARRILRYRERLGGFVHPGQVRETYQLPDSVFEQILPMLKEFGNAPVRSINLNTVTIDSLGRHPYCGFAKARLIVRYREQHGVFKQLGDVLQIQVLDSNWLMRIQPYLRLE